MTTSVVHVMGALSERGAGVARAVWEMTSALARSGNSALGVRLLGLSDRDWQGAPPTGTPSGLEVESCRAVGPWPPAYSPGLASGLDRTPPGPLVVHSHGMWLHPNWAAGRFARRRGAPLVISPHGMLCPWSFRHSGWKKFPVYHLIERRNLDRAACILASSRMEADDIRAFRFCAPVAVVPFGLSLEEFTGGAEADKRIDQAWKALLADHPGLTGRRIVLFLGRIHPVKAPEQLVEAFAGVCGGRDEFHLVFAGPDSPPTCSRLKDLAQRLGIAGRLTFTGAVAGDGKHALLRKSEVLVLCSHNENFGYVVPEALASGTPVVTSDRTPWGEVAARGCGWTYPHGVEGLAAAIGQFVGAQSDQLRAMGAAGREWIHSEFGWGSVARRLESLYQWTLDGGPPPPFVEMPS